MLPSLMESSIVRYRIYSKSGEIKEKYCCTTCTKLANKYNYTNKIFTFVNGCKCSAIMDHPPLSHCYEIKK